MVRKERREGMVYHVYSNHTIWQDVNGQMLRADHIERTIIICENELGTADLVTVRSPSLCTGNLSCRYIVAFEASDHMCDENEHSKSEMTRGNTRYDLPRWNLMNLVDD